MSFLLPTDERARLLRDKLLKLLFAVLVVVLVVRAEHKSEGVILRNRDFGGRFIARQDPYFDPAQGHRIHGPYPPSFVLVAAPLALLERDVARFTWAGLQIVALVVAFVVLRRWTLSAWPANANEVTLYFGAALLLASRFLLRDMAGGGGNLIFGTLALCAIDQCLRGNDVAGGVLLASSLVLKPNLAPLILLLVVWRRWKAAIATVCAGALLFSLPALWFGVERYAALSTRWASDVLAYARLDDRSDPARVPDGLPVADSSMNQSLREAVARALDVAQASGAQRATIAMSLSTVLAGVLVLVTCWSAAGARSARARLLAACAFLPLCLLVSPISWKAHHVVLLPLFFVLANAAFEGRRWSWLATLLALYYVACDLANEELLGKPGKEWLQTISIVTWADIVLLVAALALARRADRASAVQSDLHSPV